METRPGRKGFIIPFNSRTHRFIIFSDQHKGRKNAADDFVPSEKNYLNALDYYNEHNFHLIALGDCEEIWENTLLQVMNHNQRSFEKEKQFVAREAFTKIVGNHDLDWEIDPLAPSLLKKIYGNAVPVLQGIILETTMGSKTVKIFCTHGHQGDLRSDGNWFSKLFVTKVWAPVQAYLRIHPNTPAYDRALKTAHNRMMYEWAREQEGLILITGHTHQPVFGSLTLFERLQLEHRKALSEHNAKWAEALENEMMWRSAEATKVADDYSNLKPAYFNTGCCCYSDGDITGIEIADEHIRLIKWKQRNGTTERVVLQEAELSSIITSL